MSVELNNIEQQPAVAAEAAPVSQQEHQAPVVEEPKAATIAETTDAQQPESSVTENAETSAPQPEANHAEIKKQIEFYFSDSNLKGDKFLREKINADPFVDLAILSTFSRMKTLNPSLDIAVLKEALKDSENLELSQDGLKVKRKIEFKPQSLKDCQKYIASNIPLTATLDELMSLFQPFNPLLVKMQKPARKFNGKCFLEFSESENLENLSTLKFGDQELSFEKVEKKTTKRQAKPVKEKRGRGNKKQKTEVAETQESAPVEGEASEPIVTEAPKVEETKVEEVPTPVSEAPKVESVVEPSTEVALEQ